MIENKDDRTVEETKDVSSSIDPVNSIDLVDEKVKKIEKIEEIKEIEESPSSLTHVFFHTCIRNDDHCPDCRVHTLSFHSTLEAAVNQAVSESSWKDGEDEDDDNREDLLCGECVWIGEWIRRSNGDSYQILPIRYEQTYNPLKTLSASEQKDDAGTDDVSDTFDVPETTLYAFVKIEINQNKYCPDNATFKVSFHKSFELAMDEARDRYLEDSNPYYDDDERQHLEEMSDAMKAERVFWKPSLEVGAKEHDGIHYQIVQVSDGDIVTLNKLCQHLV